MVLGAAAVVGSAGLAWAVGEDPLNRPSSDRSGTSTPGGRVSPPLTTAPTPSPTTTATPVVSAVPSPSSAVVDGPSSATTSGTGVTSAPEPEPVPTAEPKPQRTKPGKGVTPTTRPTRPSK